MEEKKRATFYTTQTDLNEFKKACIDNNISPSQCFDNIMKDYTKKNTEKVKK